MIKTFGTLSVLACVAYVALVLGAQRRLVFPAPRTGLPSAAVLHPDVEVLDLDGVEAWLAGPLGNREGPAPAVIFSHGNGELIDHWLAPMRTLRERGVAVLLVEYPGYGRSRGRPSEKAITRTLIAGYDALVARRQTDPERVIAYGRSLGGGAACALARHRPLAALILESTFTSVRRMARAAGVLGPLVLDPFESLDVVRDFAGPVLVVHGRHDAIIPVAHGRALHDAARQGTLHVLACGHNDCPRPWDEIDRFLAAHGLL